jgi:hypothetical protein
MLWAFENSKEKNPEIEWDTKNPNKILGAYDYIFRNFKKGLAQ